MPANKKTKILFVAPHSSTFIQKDRVLLSKHFKVRTEYYTGEKNVSKVIRIFRRALWSDLTFSWFADYHAYHTVLISRLLKKKSIVVVGGYEVSSLPEINYGLARSPESLHKVKYTLEKTDRVLTVSESLKLDAMKNIGVNGKNIITVPNGYDHERFSPKGKKENSVLTAFTCSDWRRIRLKGLDTFVKTAKFLPHVQFLMIGIHGKVLEELRGISPPNVVLIKPLPQEELIPYYQKTKVYCQLSMREGHPNAVSEAMLCECVPVGTDVPGIRAVMGETGFYVPYGDAEKTARAIEEALNSDKGQDARDRVKTMFPLEKREQKFVNIINDLKGIKP
ncbi:MAG: glycosyltransferase family 4 protein [Candidatus Aminicenantes bacterium]|nr:MAG: glycosyltransferase family 4 protein [Candidatus Aminicenantes bacterium]